MMANFNITGGNNLLSNLLLTGDNNVSVPDFDFDVGYSPNGEDLDDVDTEYILPDNLVELESENLNVQHLNIRGAINKQDSLSRLLTKMRGRNKVSIVSLNETWLRHDTECKFDIPGYNYVGKVRTGKKGEVFVSYCQRK